LHSKPGCRPAARSCGSSPRPTVPYSADAVSMPPTAWKARSRVK
jgi:hypothetical protein